MATYQPPYTITPNILNRVVEIGELLGRWSMQAAISSPLLRKENRIRTIQASLAIEHNSLSTEQVTAIIEGKRVLAPARDIQEVRNAILAYEKLPHWHSSRLTDLLAAHRLLMTGLVDHPGQLRQGDVGIYRENQLIHMAPPANQVLRLMDDLLTWLKQTDIHPLIASSIFHYEFEFIHPFTDGNGRMGRLWQTLILSEWRTELAWLPVETLIHHQQQHYYQVLRECDRTSNCTLFIDFMLEKLAEALKESLSLPKPNPATTPVEMSVEMSVQMSVENPQSLNATAQKILSVIAARPAITITQLADELGVSRRTIERNIKLLQDMGRLMRVGAKKGGYWRVSQ
ncbi:Fic family protein [Xenorhabdus doucetiae]|uniref:Fic family protein n=1 Tax=Xenorhabdus doucetiae TaxID=351671 RepID=A0A068QV23_9GAMM|nr:Fic family protein [Xenorhabdus doucetiae]TYP01583.1 Fic family protein [Xenorhabdus doucetiae]CDG18852.1 Restriction modification system DNA specificity domain:Filamentation induced by cAMP protein Fic [Xenorhabdus doucetiae]